MRQDREIKIRLQERNMKTASNNINYKQTNVFCAYFSEALIHFKIYNFIAVCDVKFCHKRASEANIGLFLLPPLRLYVTAPPFCYEFLLLECIIYPVHRLN